MTARLVDAFSDMFQNYERPERRTIKAATGSFRADAGTSSTQLVPQFSIQHFLRPLYDKGPPSPARIGHHPDFLHLAHTEGTERHAITTMFMDLEGSTRLSRFLELEDVYRIKNAFIRAAIEVVHSFDGHVHRIMGDAVMAFFGRRGQPAEQGAIDGLNCAAALSHAVRSLVIPALGNDQLGVRIGLDHGPRDDVLWSAYGYPGVEEVTATSFYVDVAAKLQQSASRNRVMIGQSLKEFLDFPEDLLRVKQVVRKGVDENQPYVSPNYSGPDGRPMNYRQFELDIDNYLLLSPLAPSLDSEASGLHVAAELYATKDGPRLCRAIPTGVAIGKRNRARDPRVRVQDAALVQEPCEKIHFVPVRRRGVLHRGARAQTMPLPGAATRDRPCQHGRRVRRLLEFELQRIG